MKVLLLGGTGFVGRVIARLLGGTKGMDVVIASRRPAPGHDARFVMVDATSASSIRPHGQDADVIINCITGSGETIRDSARAIVEVSSGMRRPIHVIHMSSMSVYGARTGVMTASDSVSDDGNWYGQAKIEAESILREYADDHDDALTMILRIGCVFGAGSALWVDRVGQLLQAGRLGDLAEAGDGWSNLVHVNDIAAAVLLGIRSELRGTRIYNLAAPDSPRWNEYFRDFALALGCVPLKYMTPLRMLVESRMVAPPIKLLERLATRGWSGRLAIESMPPSLLRLWAQQIRLDSSAISNELGLRFTPYRVGLDDSIEYFKAHAH